MPEVLILPSKHAKTKLKYTRLPENNKNGVSASAGCHGTCGEPNGRHTALQITVHNKNQQK